MEQRYYYYRKKINYKNIIRDLILVYILSVIVVLFLNSMFFRAYKVPSVSMAPQIDQGTYIICNNFSYGPIIPLTNIKIFNGNIYRGDIVIFYSKDYSEKPYLYRSLVTLIHTLSFSLLDITSFSKEGLPNIMIKRVIGVPGDEIKIVTENLIDHIYINGKYEKNVIPINYFLVEDSNLDNSNNLNQNFTKTIVLEEDQFYLLGDNRINSVDSRDWGTVTRKQIIGKAILKYWPFNRFGVLNK